MVVDRHAPYVVIRDPSLGRDCYYVADGRLIKEGIRRDDGGCNMPNHFRINQGGARIGQFYRLSETAVAHKDELNELYRQNSLSHSHSHSHSHS